MQQHQRHLPAALPAASCLYALPSLRQLHLEDVQRLAAGLDTDGGLGAFSPCLPGLDSLILRGTQCFSPELEFLLPACGRLQALELDNVLNEFDSATGDMATSAAEVSLSILQALATLTRLTKLKWAPAC